MEEETTNTALVGSIALLAVGAACGVVGCVITALLTGTVGILF